MTCNILVQFQVLPGFREFQASRNVTFSKDGFHEFPCYYRSVDTESIECLFFQDVSEKSFTMIDKNEVTPEHVLLVIKVLAKFHAVSFAMRDQEPENFSKFVKELPEMFFIRGDTSGFSTMINNAAVYAINSITEDSDAHLLDALLRLYEHNQYDMIAELLDGNAAEPYSCIVHGDLWPNNIMFKLNSKNMPRKACLIDWQLSRYASPIVDLMYFIFLTTTRELRGRNYNVYLNTYYECLSNHLTR